MVKGQRYQLFTYYGRSERYIATILPSKVVFLIINMFSNLGDCKFKKTEKNEMSLFHKARYCRCSGEM